MRLSVLRATVIVRFTSRTVFRNAKSSVAAKGVWMACAVRATFPLRSHVVGGNGALCAYGNARAATLIGGNQLLEQTVAFLFCHVAFPPLLSAPLPPKAALAAL